MRTCLPGVLLIALQASSTLPAHADQKADTLLAEVQAAYKAAKTMTVTLTSTLHTQEGTEEDRYTLILQKPDKSRLVLKTIKGAKGDMDHTEVSDGRTTWLYKPITNQYTREAVVSGSVLGLVFETTGMLFFQPGGLVPPRATLALLGTKVTSRYAGTKKLGKLVCKILVITTSNAFGGNTRTLYIGPDKLIHREIVHSTMKGQPGIDEDTTVIDLKVNAPLSAADFTFVPPANAKEVKELK